MRSRPRRALAWIGPPEREWWIASLFLGVAGAAVMWQYDGGPVMLSQAGLLFVLGWFRLPRRVLVAALSVTLVVVAFVAVPVDAFRRAGAWSSSGGRFVAAGGSIFLDGREGPSVYRSRWSVEEVQAAVLSFQARQLFGDVDAAWFTTNADAFSLPGAGATGFEFGEDAWARRRYVVPQGIAPIARVVLSGTAGRCGNVTLARPTIDARTAERVCLTDDPLEVRLRAARVDTDALAVLTLAFPPGTYVRVQRSSVTVLPRADDLPASPAGLEIRARAPGDTEILGIRQIVEADGDWRPVRMPIAVPYQDGTAPEVDSRAELRLSFVAQRGMAFEVRDVRLQSSDGGVVRPLPLPARAAYGTRHPNLAGHGLATVGAGVTALAGGTMLATIAVGLAFLAVIPTGSHIAIAALGLLGAWLVAGLSGLRGASRAGPPVALVAVTAAWLASRTAGVRAAILGADRPEIWRTVIEAAVAGDAGSAQLPFGAAHAHNFVLELLRSHGAEAAVAGLIVLACIVVLAGRRFGINGYLLGMLVVALNVVDTTLFSWHVIVPLALVLQAGSSKRLASLSTPSRTCPKSPSTTSSPRPRRADDPLR